MKYILSLLLLVSHAAYGWEGFFGIFQKYSKWYLTQVYGLPEQDLDQEENVGRGKEKGSHKERFPDFKLGTLERDEEKDDKDTKELDYP